MASFANPPTEARNAASETIDQLPTLEMLRIINHADQGVAIAVEQQLPAIAAAVDAIVTRLQRGGRLFYIGAGTSGRLGVLDASECTPTYNVSPTLVQGIMAGGDTALRIAIEDVEDDPTAGETDLKNHSIAANDAVVGIATSGRTPYVLGALTYANGAGAYTIALTCVPGSPVAQAAAIAITPNVGPEVITGSTRMKAGTATKMILNMLSTGTMVRLGHVYSNLMVNLQPTNQKLRIRANRIVALLAGIDEDYAAVLLEQAGSLKTAIVMQTLHLNRQQAETRLAHNQGRLRQTLAKAAVQTDAETGA